MKTTKKALLLVLCAVLLVAASVLGTLAYLTATSEVAKNTFTVGDVKITLDELDEDQDEDNSDNVTVNGVTRDRANKYHLIPGKSYTKDPTVHVDSSSEKCYVRMQVTVTSYSNLKTAFPKETASDYWNGDVFLLQKLVDWSNTAWEYKSVSIDQTANTATYEFWYTSVAEPGTDLPALFEHIYVPENMSNTQIAALNDVEIDIVAHAIQTDGFESATKAWENWPTAEGNS